jgi:hypothetical protein
MTTRTNTAGGQFKVANHAADAPGGDSIGGMARAAWEASHGDFDDAAERFAKSLEADREMLRKARRMAFAAWCRDQVRQAASAHRTAVFRLRSEADAARGSRLRMALSATLMDFPLPGGGLLRDATAAACIEGATAYRHTASDAVWKARWLEAIAARVGNATVAEVLDEEDLRALQQETRVA